MLGRVFYQGPRQDSGSAGAKKVLNALNNDTKANFQENTSMSRKACPWPSFAYVCDNGIPPWLS